MVYQRFSEPNYNLMAFVFHLSGWYIVALHSIFLSEEKSIFYPRSFCSWHWFISNYEFIIMMMIIIIIAWNLFVDWNQWDFIFDLLRLQFDSIIKRYIYPFVTSVSVTTTITNEISTFSAFVWHLWVNITMWIFIDRFKYVPFRKKETEAEKERQSFAKCVHISVLTNSYEWKKRMFFVFVWTFRFCFQKCSPLTNHLHFGAKIFSLWSCWLLL